MSTAITDATPVSITCTTPASVIRYTIDGSTPTGASPIYTAPFTLTAGTRTVKAIGITAGYQDSAIATTVYTVTASVLPLFNFNNTLVDTIGFRAFTVTSGSVSFSAPVGGVGASLGAAPSTLTSVRCTFTQGGSRILSIAGWFKRLRPGGNVSWFTVTQGTNIIQSESPTGDGNTMNAKINGVNTTNFTPGSGTWTHCAYSMNMATGLFSSWVNGVQTQTLVGFTPTSEGSIIADLNVVSYGEDWGIDNFHLGETFLTTAQVVALMNYRDV